jgi:hypothetical protein
MKPLLHYISAIAINSYRPEKLILFWIF